ncbi:MAG: T9SS type A sorting domain-containing protein [Bacteroidia bacterium]|nr:T9SS type A sorting domain-containing protein [Bacteroidia bacterium]
MRIINVLLPGLLLIGVTFSAHAQITSTIQTENAGNIETISEDSIPEEDQIEHVFMADSGGSVVAVILNESSDLRIHQTKLPRPYAFLSPNPSNGRVSLISVYHPMLYIRLLSVSGELLMARSINSQFKSEINLANYQNGLYFVQIQLIDGMCQTEKLILNNK